MVRVKERGREIKRVARKRGAVVWRKKNVTSTRVTSLRRQKG